MFKNLIIKTVSKFYLIIMFIFLYIPIFLLILFSFNSSKSRAVWENFTFDWYKYLFTDTIVIQAIINTLVVAGCAAIISSVLGFLACISAVNVSKKKYFLISILTNIPIMNPEIVTGVSSMLFFVFLQKFCSFFKPGLMTLIITHSTFCVPYTFLAILPKLKQITPQTYESACDLGLPPVKAFFKVVLPEIMPGIITGIMVVFAMSIDDFIISYFTCGSVQTLPILIYAMTRKSINPEINAISTIIFVVVFIILIFANLRKNENLKLNVKI